MSDSKNITTMKNKAIKIEIEKTLNCIDKIEKVKPSSDLFEKIKKKLS